ncbi:putative NagD-like phosphatase [Planococcus halocryophilus Or1]|uniref:Acid sugar phosphatase n=1 Tax=Planococcus halocryophilus TaxID=1215089 RepID=A0A1C7DMY9_9BACL|nr:TIGR01457 family HAD-type hydrolase [Planococcus halocryophilus]ANU12583.1 HAD family hydrolase [Planococcus halocryophilus]EMF46662.1 putative NagD-like phosphatase [Planococcus halocryophilus Or1]
METRKTYRAYCLDLDGTVYRGSEIVEEAAEFIEQLQQQEIEPFYITNNASKTQQQLQDKLAGFGIAAKKERIMSSAIAAAKYIKRWYPEKTVYMIGSDGLDQALRQEGLERVEEEADIVLIGLDRSITYDKLATACLEVRKGAVFLSTNKDLAFPSEKGFLPGNGAITRLVSASTGVEPVFIGKPEIHMLEAIQHESGFEKSEMVMIGDNYDTDIQAGIRFGIDTIHVNTGVSSTETVVEKEHPPTYTIDNLGYWKI